MLPFYQIIIAYVNCSVYYVVFMRYKLRNSGHRALRVLMYMMMYVLFVLIVVIIAVSEKFLNGGPSELNFFSVFAEVMGYISAVCSGVVWIPQIIELLRLGKRGSVSPWMFVLQTPGWLIWCGIFFVLTVVLFLGNIVIIVFQAVFFKQHISTWISYVITCVEQATILVIMCWFCWRDRNLGLEIIINDGEIESLV